MPTISQCVEIYQLCWLQYQLGHREISQLSHRENKAYTLGLSQLLVFIAVAMNTGGFFSYQCIHFIFSMIELRIFSMTEPVLYKNESCAAYVQLNNYKLIGGTLKYLFNSTIILYRFYMY